MSTTSTRIPTRLVDTIGILAVVAGLIFGLLPGIASPDAHAGEGCDDIEGPAGREFLRFRLELDEDGDGTVDLVVDTDDPNVTCEEVGNSLRVLLNGEPVEVTNQQLSDYPNFHLSCSEDYDGEEVVIGGSDSYEVLAWNLAFDGPGYNADCNPFPPPQTWVKFKKIDQDGNHLNGITFGVFSGHDADPSGTPVATCITGPDATDADANHPNTPHPDGWCYTKKLPVGEYTLHELDVPDGYEPSPLLPLNFEITSSTGDVLYLPSGSSSTATFTNTRLTPYTITVNPDGRNAVGNTHDFIVTLEADGDPVADATVALSWSGVGSIQSPGSTCTTNASGQCTVIVHSDAPGSGVLTATFDTPYQNTIGSAPGNTTSDGDGGVVRYSDISDSADKTWVGYVATIEADGTNLVGDAHTFTATVWEVDGQGTPDGEIAEDVTVTVEWTEAPDGATISPPDLDCTTNESGQCSFTVNSPDNSGAGTITIVQLDGVIAGIDGQADENLSDTTPTAAPDGSLSAVKIWREYRASIDDDSVNPVGQAHTFTVTVQYSDDGGSTWENPGSGITVDWTGPTPDGSNDLTASTCDNGTDAAGTCTIVVTSDSPGQGTVTVTEVDGDLVPGGTATESFDVPDVTATKTWLDFTVDVQPSAVNMVGEDHTFTVTVKRSDDGDAFSPIAEGSVIAFNLSDPTTLVSETCSDPGVDADGECTVTVNSTDTGTVTLEVTGIDGYAEFDEPTDITFVQAGTATKTWVDYRAFIEADGINLVGDAHTFTVTAQVDDGTGWGPVEDGTVVTVTSSGLAASVDQSDCADGTTDGTCDVVVDSDDPGTVTITVDTVSNETAVDSPVLTVDVDGGENLDQGQATSADKTWIEYRASIVESATNLTGQEHVFTVTAEQNSGSGWGDVPNGTEVGFSTTNDSTVQSDTCDSTDGGQCTITVDSSAVDSVTVTVDSVSAEDVDGDPSATVANGALSAAPDGSLDATKDWVAVLVDVEADATNVVGESHVFTVDVDIVTPGGTIAAPDGTTVVVTEDGVGAIESQTCDSPGTSGGSCTVTVNSSAPGDSTITAESVTFTYDSTQFTVDFTLEDSTVGEAGGQDLTATKTWRDYRIDIEADGLNLVRDEHTFTVTIEQTDDGGSWSAVPDGTTATVGIAGSAGSITGGTCEDTGTVDGDCTVVVNSTSAGTGTVTVSAISVDLPEEQRTGISVDVADDSADKTWIAFRGLISDDSLNVTGDSHDFTLTGQYTTNGSTWVDVPNGSSIGFSASGVGSTSGDTCDSTVDGDCTVTVTSDDSGQREVTLESIHATVTVDGITESFDVTLEDEASGVLDGADLPVDATKTWASYALELTPAEAVNLLDGTDDDPEQDHVITVILSSDDAVNAPVGGQDVAVALSGDTGTITAVEAGSIDSDFTATCTTDTEGTCDVTITSSTPGTAVLSGSYEATVGESDPVIVESNDAEKIWTTFRVTVTPVEATNLVGNPHTFTVLVEQSNSDGVWLPVIDAVPSISLDADTATITGNTCVDGTVDDDPLTLGIDEAGTCLVTVDSDNVEAVTLTATYEASVGQTTAAFSDQGDKTWIDFGIDVTPDTDENLVGTDHVFTVTVTTTFPVLDGTSTVPVVGADVAVQLDGLGTITDNGCAEGTDANGQCTVTVTSGAAGASSLTAVYMGTAEDDAEVRAFDDTAFKDWVDYELEISPDAVNAVGDAHTFTATLTVDTGEGFGPAAGEALQFTFDGVGAVVGGDVDADLACTTDGAGTCDIVINSEEGGTSTVGVSYDAVAGATSETLTQDAVKQWIDISLVKTAVVGDGFGDGDLVSDPDTGLPTLFFTTSDRGPKTAVFEYVITNTGGDTLFDLALVDDRLGGIDLATQSDCPDVLAVGESCTARATEQYTYEDAAGGLSNIIINVGVVTASGDDGSEVSDTDDAVIQLIAQQSSILIDLQKDVVVGAGDVEAPDGPPTVTWSQSELEAGASKVVRYAFTVTNIGPSPIVDVELVDPMISSQPIIAVADGVTLQPGESTVVEVDYVLTADEAFPDGPTAGELPNVAAVSGANETRDAFDQDSDDAIVFVQVVFAEQDQRPLPATGLGSGGLLPLAVLLVAVGAAILWLDRRRVTGR